MLFGTNFIFLSELRVIVLKVLFHNDRDSVYESNWLFPDYDLNNVEFGESDDSTLLLKVILRVFYKLKLFTLLISNCKEVAYPTNLLLDVATVYK